MPNPIPPPPPEKAAHAPHPQHSTNVPLPAPSPYHNSQSGAFPRIAVTILVIIIVVGGIILIVRHRKQADQTSGPSVAQIQQMFQPPTATGLPVGQAGLPMVVTSTSSPTTATIPTQAPTTTPQSQLYANTALGFQVQLAPSWQAKPFSDSEVILADQNGAQATIQAINNPSTDLNTIQTQLRGSPTVKNLTTTTFENQPALSFNTTSGQQGLAIIYNNRLYYIIGQLNNQPLASFQFISGF